jgi:hypothetical protein
MTGKEKRDWGHSLTSVSMLTGAPAGSHTGGPAFGHSRGEPNMSVTLGGLGMEMLGFA